MYVDTHLHLDEPWLTDPEKRQRVIEDITANGILTFAQSCDLASYEKIVDWSKQSDYVIPSFGILPWFANQYMDRLDEVAKLCETAVMLGEIGLDLASSRNEATKEEQLALLDVFLKAAETHDMVLNLHFRGGMEPEGLEVLKRYDVKRAIFHWYSGTLELMDEINEAGFYYSVGQMHLPRRRPEEREEIAAMVRKIPDNRLLLEIDVLPRDVEAMPSEVFRGILEDIAEIKGMSRDDVEALNQRNVQELVGDSPRVAEITALLRQS
jgi:TatD DNase family protein